MSNETCNVMELLKIKTHSLEDAQNYALKSFETLLNNKRYPLSQRETTKELIEICVECGYKFAQISAKENEAQ